MKTEALLKKYLESGLTDAERFELEKRALDDAFLADAWEGLQLYQSADYIANWKTLKNKWTTKQDSKKATRIVSFKKWLPMAAAASVLLLAGTFFWINPSKNNFEKSNPVALEVEMEGQTGPDLVEESALEESLEKVRAIAKEEKVEEDLGTTVVPENIQSAKRRSTSAYTAESAAPKELEKANQEPLASISEDATDTESLAGVPQPVELAESGTDEQMKGALGPAAAVAEKDSKIESATANREAIKVKQEFRTTGASSSFAEQKVVADIVQATPDIGWEAFQEVIKNNAISKADAFLRGGLVPPITSTIQFELDEDRRPINIKIIRGYNEMPRIHKIMNESGTWTTDSAPIEIEITIPLKE